MFRDKEGYHTGRALIQENWKPSTAQFI